MSLEPEITRSYKHRVRDGGRHFTIWAYLDTVPNPDIMSFEMRAPGGSAVKGNMSKEQLREYAEWILGVLEAEEGDDT